MNLIASRKREHSRKPDELYQIVEALLAGALPSSCSPATRAGWLGGLGRRVLSVSLVDHG